MARKKARIRRKVVVGHDADGKTVVKWVGGYTVKEVEAKKQELIKHFIMTFLQQKQFNTTIYKSFEITIKLTNRDLKRKIKQINSRDFVSLFQGNPDYFPILY